MLEPNLDHLAAFLAYVEDRGSCFSWWYLKKLVLGFLARSGNIRSNQCYRLMVCLRISHSECPHSLLTLWYGLRSCGHLQPIYRLGTFQNPKLGQFILCGSLPLCPIYKDGYVPLRMCLSCQESHETLNWGILFHAISPFSLPLMG